MLLLPVFSAYLSYPRNRYVLVRNHRNRVLSLFTLICLPYNFSLGLTYSTLFLVGTKLILLTTYLSNQPSNSSVSEKGIVFMIV